MMPLRGEILNLSGAGFLLAGWGLGEGEGRTKETEGGVGSPWRVLYSSQHSLLPHPLLPIGMV